MIYHSALTTMLVGQVTLRRVWLTPGFAQARSLTGLTSIDGVVRRVQVMCANVAEIRCFVWMMCHAAVLLCYVMSHAEPVTHHGTNGYHPNARKYRHRPLLTLTSCVTLNYSVTLNFCVTLVLQQAHLEHNRMTDRHIFHVHSDASFPCISLFFLLFSSF